MSVSADSTTRVDPTALLRLSAFGSLASMRVCDSLTAPLADAFAVTTVEAAHAISFFAIAYGLLQAFYGPLSDRIGKTRVIGLATAGCALANLFVLLAPSMPAVSMLRALSGAFAAGIVPIGMAYIGDTVPYDQRQPALARFMTATLTGMICGQWFGGVLAEAIHWRAPFAVLTLIFVAALVAQGRAGLLRAAPPAPPDAGAASRASFIAQVGGIAAEPWARVVLLLVFLEGAAAFSLYAMVPTHLHQRFGLSMTVAGGILALLGVGGMLYTFSAARLIRRLGEAGMARLGGTLLAVSFLLLGLETRAWLAAPACLIGGLGLYMLHNTLQTNATQLSQAYRGTAVSMFASSLFVGQSVGVAVAAELVGSGQAGALFIACAAVAAALGIGFSIAIGRRQRA
ncbi:MAG: MFS transporter [Burkholderiaceae bacterium]